MSKDRDSESHPILTSASPTRLFFVRLYDVTKSYSAIRQFLGSVSVLQVGVIDLYR